MSNEIQLQSEGISGSIVQFGNGFGTMSEAQKFAEIVCKTEFVPKTMQGKPFDVLIAMEMGAEIGLKPMQSIQNISVINGRPSVWGDAALALVKSHKDYEYCKEYLTNDNSCAICEIKRRNEPVVTASFSIKDAEVAGLISSATSPHSPWRKYQKRMLQMRARGFALRDSFPDALKGLITAEEAQDFNVIQNQETKQYKNVTPVENEIITNGDVVEEVPEEEITHDLEEKMIRRENVLSSLDKMLVDNKFTENEVRKWTRKGGVNNLSELKLETLEAIHNKYK